MKRWTLLLLVVTGCASQPSAPGPEAPPEPPAQTESDPPDPLSRCEAAPLEAPLTHLTPLQFANAVRDALGVEVDPTLLPAAIRVGGYENDGRRGELTALTLAAYAKAIASVAEAAAPALAPSCAAADAGCLTGWIRDIGLRAFRRPLTEEEVGVFSALHATARASEDEVTGAAWVLEALLQSPQFLYLAWVTTPEGDAERLDDFSIASRMAAFVWNGIPDEALLAAAGSGRLGSPEARAEEARRMLEDPRAAAAVAHFHDQYLRLEELPSSGRDTNLYPLWSPALLEAMREETRRFTARLVTEPGGTVKTLLTSSETEVNGPLAELYGVSEGPPEWWTWARVKLDASQRAGVLTHASLLTTRAHPVTTSPIKRGHFVLERLLCQPLPPPPSTLDLQLPEATEGMTTREFYEPTRQQPACAGCHTMMNPLGYAFEHYDPIGAWRDIEEGDPRKVVDSKVELHGYLAGIDGPLSGAVELTHRLAESPMVADCYAQHWMGYAHAQRLEANSCAVQSLQEGFRAAGGEVRALIERIVASEAFVLRAPQTCDGG